MAALIPLLLPINSDANEVCGNISQRAGATSSPTAIQFFLAVPQAGGSFEIRLKIENRQIGMRVLHASTLRNSRVCVAGNFEVRDVFVVRDIREDQTGRIPRGPVPMR